MRIAVAGGSGMVGRMVVDSVRAGGDVAVVLARSAGVNLITGAGLDEALVSVSTVIDVSNLTTTSKTRSIAFFQNATANLLDAGKRAGVTHHVVLSIVGSDRVPLGYYFGKRRQEQLVRDAEVPATVLRATQFHEFAGQMLARAGMFVLVPKMLSQPVAAREVAARLCALAHQPPAGLVPDLAGPEQLTVPDMVRRLAVARGTRRIVVSVQLPGAAGRGMTNGGLLPSGDAVRGVQTYEQWLGQASSIGDEQLP